MIATGKRHDMRASYEIGFDDDGRILAMDATYRARCGFSADLSGPVTDRTLFHAENSYWLPAVRLRSEPMKTNTVSNTAYRGFGGPQGVVGAERARSRRSPTRLASTRSKCAAATSTARARTTSRPTTRGVQDNILRRITDELEASSDYQARRAKVLEFNESSPFIPPRHRA